VAKSILEYTEWVRLYESGVSSYQIAKQYGCDISTVCKKLKKMGIIMRPHKEKERHKELALLYPEWVKMYESGMSTVEIGRKYGIDHSTVWAALKKMGVRIRKPEEIEWHRKYYYDHDNWAKLYLEGMSVKKIAKLYNTSGTTNIVKTLKRKGVEVRNPSCSQKKYEVQNDDVFDVINTQDKAYFLGFLMADGTIRNYEKNKSSWSMGINLSKNDYEMADKLAEFLGVYLIDQNRLWSFDFNNKTATLKVSSKRLVQSLISHGCIPRKSLVLQYPHKSLSGGLNRHFIRGFFDGDGCVGVSKRYKNGGCGIHVIFTTGSLDFLQSLQSMLTEKANIEKFHLMKQKNYNAYHLTIHRKADILKIYHYLYDNATVCLDRKKEKFEELLKANNLI